MLQPTNQSPPKGWCQYFKEEYQGTARALKHEDCLTMKIYKGVNFALFGEYGLWTHKKKVAGVVLFVASIRAYQNWNKKLQRQKSIDKLVVPKAERTRESEASSPVSSPIDASSSNKDAVRTTAEVEVQVDGFGFCYANTASYLIGRTRLVKATAISSSSLSSTNSSSGLNVSAARIARAAVAAARTTEEVEAQEDGFGFLCADTASFLTGRTRLVKETAISSSSSGVAVVNSSSKLNISEARAAVAARTRSNLSSSSGLSATNSSSSLNVSAARSSSSRPNGIRIWGAGMSRS